MSGGGANPDAAGKPFQGSKGKGVFMIGFATLITFLTAGVVFGFNCVKNMLQADGAYSWMCKKGEETPCPAQLSQLDTMFAVASVVLNLATFPVGMFMDRFGPKYTSTLGTVFHVFGLLCLAYSSEQFEGYVIGYTCMALGGLHMFLSHIDMINIFPAFMGTVNGLLTGAFDSSSLIPVIWAAFYDNGTPVQSIFLSYLVVSVSNFLFCMFFLGRKQIQPPSKEDEEMEQLLGDGTDEEREESSRKTTFYNLYEGTAMDQILSWEFALGAYFTSFGMLQLNFLIQTIDDQLRRGYTDDEHKALSAAFDLILPIGGVASIPFIGFVLDYGGVVASFVWLECLFILYTILSLVPSADTQYITFIVFVAARTSLYASVTDYTGRMFGFKNFGTVYGALMSISAIICLVQNPLAQMVITTFEGDYSKMKYIFIGLQSFSAALPIYLYTKNASIQKETPLTARRLRTSSVASFGYGTASISE